MVKCKPLSGCHTRQIMLPTCGQIRVSTILEDADLRRFPEDIAFHGTKASEIKFFERGDGLFSGHGIFIKSSSVSTLQQLFTDEINSLGICIRTASYLSYGDSGRADTKE